MSNQELEQIRQRGIELLDRAKNDPQLILDAATQTLPVKLAA